MEQQWNRQAEASPPGPLVDFLNAASLEQGEDDVSTPKTPTKLDVRTITTKDLNSHIKILKGRQGPENKPEVTYRPIPIIPRNPDGRGDECKAQWVIHKNTMKGPYIRAEDRKFEVTRYTNTCYGTSIQVKVELPKGERAIQKIRSIVRSKAHIKNTRQRERRGHSGDSEYDFYDSRQSGKSSRSGVRMQGNQHLLRRKSARRGRPKMGMATVSRQKRTYNSKYDTYRRFLGYY